jgi:uncharacterized protein
MKSYLKIILSVGAVGLLAGLVFVSFSKETSPPFVEMEIKGVSLDTIGRSPVVLLVDKEGKRMLPVWIGLLEANAIDNELNAVTSPRPMTHDLLHSILAKMHFQVKEVRIVDLKEGTYYATLFLKSDKEKIEIDARPSDAIVLALKSKAPVLVAAGILNEQGVSVTAQKALGERSGIRTQELTPALASHFEFREKKGVLVAEVLSESPAETSGIRAGDIVTKVNSREVGSVEEFERAFDDAKPGGSARLLLFRDGKAKEVTLSVKP